MPERKNKYYFTTRDLVTIAVLGALGGVFSVYFGYMITEAYNAIRVWFPVAESFSGIHLIWILLVLGITNKKGSGVLAGGLKGFMEFIMGSRLGLFVILLSLVEGIFAEIGFWPFRKYRKISYLLAGGLGTVANVVAFQFYSPFADMTLFTIAAVMSFISGVVLSGVLGLGIMDGLEEAGIIRKESLKKEGVKLTATKVAAVLVALSLLILFGSVFFLAPGGQSANPSPSAPPVASESLTFQVTGSVNLQKEYAYYDYGDAFKTIDAPAIGNPHENHTYTGLSLNYALNASGVKPGATKVDVIGSDGYYNTLDLAQVMGDDTILIVDNGGHLKVIAKNLSQEYWVDMIKTIKVH